MAQETATTFGNCAICLQTILTGPSALGCGHVYHDECISQWLQVNTVKRECPLCRKRCCAPIKLYVLPVNDAGQPFRVKMKKLKKMLRQKTKLIGKMNKQHLLALNKLSMKLEMTKLEKNELNQTILTLENQLTKSGSSEPSKKQRKRKQYYHRYGIR